MLDCTTPLGEQIKNLFDMFNVKFKYFTDSNNDNLHLEFFPTGFDMNSHDQALLLASICYHIKTGYWKTSIEALHKIIPNSNFDFSSDEAIKKYFSGEEITSRPTNEEIRQGSVPADCWLEDAKSNEVIYEESIFNPTYGTVLTLLGF